MRLLSFAAFVALAASVHAQTVIQVAVGGVQSQGENIFMFKPGNVTAQNGDVVQFTFSGIPGNHSITQSTFASPCQGMTGGFDSGWVFVPPNHDANSGPAPTWNLTITDASKPIWFFCKQLVPQPHCSSGMVGAINAPASGNTFDNYANNAKSAGPSDQGIGALVGQGASASAVPGPIAGDVKYFGTPAASGAAPGTTPTGNGGSTSGSSQPTGGAAPNGATSLINANSGLALAAGLLGVLFA